MSLLKNRFYLRTKISVPSTYVETGTFKGKNLETILLSQKYSKIHSIDLSPRWYSFNRAKFSNHIELELHLGDSAEVLRRLIPEIKEPIHFFLDAHYSGPGTAFGKKETPVLEELESISMFSLSDETVIIIDDCRMLGKRSLTKSNSEYKGFDSDWSDITRRKISDAVGSHYLCLENNLRYWTHGKVDQLIFVRVNGFRRVLISGENRLIKIISVGIRAFGKLKNLIFKN
jgi:hypothetical protein